MSYYFLRKDYQRQFITYVTMLCILFSNIPSSLSADVAVLTNRDECDRRTQIAYGVAGVAAVALIGGLVYAASVSGKRCHSHSSSCSSSSYCYSSSSYHYSDYYDYYDGFFIDEVIPGTIAAPGPIARQKIKKSQKQKVKQLTGLFVSHVATVGQGSVTAFVQLPNGTRQVLGHLPLSGNANSLPFGPFDQDGNYTFGISVDEGTTLPAQTSVGSVNIEINGSMTQSYDFIVPPNPPAHYEPAPHSFSLL